MIKNYIKEKYNKPGNVYLGLVHRLDRPTGGIMVFAKTSKAAKRLSEQIRNKEFEKKYYAVAYNKFDKKEGTLIDYINKKSDNTSFITDKSNGQYAELKYEVIAEKENLSLLEIKLITGRHHQIRVQLSSRNHPIYGDQRYGKEDKNQLALYAHYLSFKHPVTKEKLEFDLKPNYSAFKKFF